MLGGEAYKLTLDTKGDILTAVTPPGKFPTAFAVMQGLLNGFPNVKENPSNLGISQEPRRGHPRWCPEQ